MSAVPALLKQAMNLMAADPARAAVLCRAAAEADASSGDAKLLWSEALRRQGQLDAARALAAPLATANKAWFGAHRQLGVILAEQGEALPAALALKTAAELNPRHPTIWRELGEQLALAGDLAGAQAAHNQHALVGGGPELASAGEALARNDAGEAERLLSAFLARHPGDVVALRLLSEAQARAGRPDEAEASLRRCLEIAPGFQRARHALSQLLLGLGRVEEALAEARRLLAQDPANKGSQRLLAAALNGMGEYEQAAEIYRRLLARDPNQAGVWMSLGHTLKTLGRTEEGVDAYRESIARKPELGESYWSLANLKIFRFTAAEIERMQGQIANPALPPRERVNFLYALAKAREDEGRVDEAFALYSEGAALHRRDNPYDYAGLSRFVDAAAALFTAEFFAARAGRGCKAEDPIFIVGLPRAGSTLLEQILASHSEVEGTMELLDLGALAQGLISSAAAQAGRTYLDALAGLSAGELEALGERYLARTRPHRKLGRRLFINKNPNDVLHVGFIKLILPNAKIIDARRHPIACGWSCFKQHFAVGQTFTYDLAGLGRYYRDYLRLAAHWDAVLPGAVHRVIHEQLAADPEPHIRALLDYCRLPFEEACLRPHETERAVRTASSEQVRRPISAAGLDSWKPYAAHLAPLAAALGEAVDAYPDTPDSLQPAAR